MGKTLYIQKDKCSIPLALEIRKTFACMSAVPGSSEDVTAVCARIKMPESLWREKKLHGKYISPCSVWINRGALAGRKSYKKERRNPRKGKILKHRLNLTQKVVIWEQRDMLYPYSVNHCCSVEIHPSIPEEKLAHGFLLVCQSFIKCTRMPSL